MLIRKRNNTVDFFINFINLTSCFYSSRKKKKKKKGIGKIKRD